MYPPQDALGGFNEDFGPQGPPHSRINGPHKGPRRRRPQAFDNSGQDSFNSDGPPPLVGEEPQDFQEGGMLHPPQGRGHAHHGGGPMNAHFADDHMMDMNDEMNMGQFHGGPQDPAFDGPPFDGPDGFGGHPHMNDDAGFVNGPDGYPPVRQQVMGFDARQPFSHESQDAFPTPNGSLPRRRRRVSDPQLPSFQDSSFQDSVGSRDRFDRRPRRTVGFTDPYDRDNDSARLYGSDPTADRRHRTNAYSDELRLNNRDSSRRGAKQVLFYGQDKPYFGFNNRSPYPVVYRGKRYPTAEHLYHSFKVSEHTKTVPIREANSDISSSNIIVRISQSSSVLALPGPMSLFLRLIGMNATFGVTGGPLNFAR